MIDFPTNDYLSDLFSDTLDNCKVSWTIYSTNQSGHGFSMNSDSHFDFKRIKYYKANLDLRLSNDQGRLKINDFELYREIMSDFINSCSELNDMFEGFVFTTQDSGYKCSFSGSDYFITDDKMIKLFLSSLNIVCYDCGLVDYNIKLVNDCVLISYHVDSVPKDIIQFIDDHDYKISRHQLLISPNFDWCEKN